jgi:putative intracellular protease/amidase
MKSIKRTLALFALFALVGCACTAAMRAQQRTTASAPAQQSAAPTATATKAPRNLAIFIFDGVQIIDYTGPYEVFGHAYDKNQPLFNIYTVSEKSDPITTAMGMTVVPKYTFDNMPKADVLVLPGGDTRQQLENPKAIKWVQDTSANAEYVLSVCNGAFYLGKAGLLDGLTATTTAGLIDRLKELAPKAKVVNDQRFVDNGKFITAAGLSSGIDGALHVIERMQGHGRAQEIALGIEYNWQPELNYSRASLADMHLRKVVKQGFAIPEGAYWNVINQQGGKDNWEKTWEVRLDASAADLLKIIDTRLSEGWTKLPAAKADTTARTLWKFTDEEGKTWNAVSQVQTLAGGNNSYKLTIKLARADSAARASLE